MKTRDAFAFRGFDGERILQRPYFRRWRAKYHVGDDLSDAAILAGVIIHYADFNVDMCEFDNEKLTELLTRLEKFQRLIQRHANAMDGRLEKYRRAVQSATAENFSLQSRLDREEKMSRVYLIDASRAVGDLLVEVKKRWQESEIDLQGVYRRRFGERLKAAREAAGLSRKNMAVKLGMSVSGYSYYERGERELTILAITRLARILNVSTEQLFERK